MTRWGWLALAAGLLGWSLTGLVLALAQRARHLAEPTDRGLHTAPTPVGGGLGLMAAAIGLWIGCEWPLTPAMWRLAAGAGLLAAVSFADDRRPLTPAARFAVQALVIGATLWSLPADVRLATALPLVLERVLLAVAWLWLINLTNFMDGIDGLLGSETITVSLGYLVVQVLRGDGAPLVPRLDELALLLAAASAGYLVWNWPPARIFMGDAGSIPLGFLSGWLMLDLAYNGHWAAALILPQYFLVDATLTLLDRLRRGARPWQAHREHAYQRAVLSGMSHRSVTLHVVVLGVALVALAAISLTAPYEALIVATSLTMALFVWLRARRPAETAGSARA